MLHFIFYDIIHLIFVKSNKTKTQNMERLPKIWYPTKSLFQKKIREYWSGGDHSLACCFFNYSIRCQIWDTCTPHDKKSGQFKNGSLLFDWHYLCQFFIKSNKDSFRISFSWGFGNCPWLLNLIKNWRRYWQSKRRLPFTKIQRPLSYVVRCN